MSAEKKLYPLRFCPVEVERSWGKEMYDLADLGVVDSEVASGWLIGDNLSDLMETYIDRVVGDDVYYYYGLQFPVSVRRLQVTGRTPLWVSPDDEIAAERYDALGKAKLWYVTAAGPKARLFLGLEKELTASAFYAGCQDGSLEDSLHVVCPAVGEAFYIAPGTVHAAEDVELMEIAEASLLDIPVFNWGQLPEEDDLGVADALDFLILKAYENPVFTADKPADTEFFTVRRLALEGLLRRFPEEQGSFLVYVCAEGEVSLQAEGMEHILLRKGQCLLVPAEISEVLLTPDSRKAVVLETAVHTAETPDSYINPDAEAFPDGVETLDGEDYFGPKLNID